MSASLTRLSDPPFDSETEPEVVARVRAGDVQAFETLFLTYYGRLVDIACRYLPSEDAAEEVVQDAFSHLWARRAQWVVRTSVRAYLYALVRHAALKVIRHDRIVAQYAEGVTGIGAFGARGVWDNRADAALLEEEMKTALSQAMHSLTPRMHQAYLLRAEHGLSYTEIAEVMGIMPKAVEKLIARARSRLHEAIAPYW